MGFWSTASTIASGNVIAAWIALEREHMNVSFVHPHRSGFWSPCTTPRPIIWREKLVSQSIRLSCYVTPFQGFFLVASLPTVPKKAYCRSTLWYPRVIHRVSYSMSVWFWRKQVLRIITPHSFIGSVVSGLSKLSCDWARASMIMTNLKRVLMHIFTIVQHHRCLRWVDQLR